MRTRSWSVAGRVFGVQVLAVLTIGVVLLIVLGLDARQSVEDDAARTSLAVSQTIAADPAVRSALGSDDPTDRLQPYAVAAMASAHVDFITIMSPDGIRFTHPDPDQIGKPFLGTITAAQRGDTITETYTGTLGPSVRAVVPVMVDGQLIGIVSAGVTTANVFAALAPRVPFVIGLSILIVVVGAAAAALTRRSLRRLTGDMAPAQMGRMVQFYESVLHSVREGVVLTDSARRVVLYNDEAADLLGLPPASAAPHPVPAAQLGIDTDVATLLDSGRRVVEETHVSSGRVLLVNQEPATAPGRSVAGGGFSAVMTLRDQSRLQSLVGELESVKTMSDALKSQAHEHANTLHTIVALLEMGRSDDAIGLIAETSRASQGMADAVLNTTADPVLAALLLGKSATAHERGIELALDLGDSVALPLSSREMVTVVGNLLDNAFDAIRHTAQPWSVELRLARNADRVVLEVTDSGTGPDATSDPFALGVSTKPNDGEAHGLGLPLVRRIVTEHHGTVEFLPGTPTRIVLILPLGATP